MSNEWLLERAIPVFTEQVKSNESPSRYGPATLSTSKLDVGNIIGIEG